MHIRDTRQLGVEIHRERKRQNLTQTQLAKKAGLLQKTISAVENGQLLTEIRVIFRILMALDLEFTMSTRVKSADDWYLEAFK